MSEALQMMSPVGRLVQGHPMKLETVIDKKTKLPKRKTDGTEIKQIFFSLAFEKVQANGQPGEFVASMWPAMQAQAVKDWPRGEYNHRDFAWKVIDGDGVDDKNVPYANREGFKGCYVLRISSGFAFQIIDMPEVGNGAMPITEENRIKRGYFGRIYATIKGNGSADSPGLYINPAFFQLCAYGPEIFSGPNVTEILRTHTAPAALPSGASRTAPPIGTAGPAPAVPGLPGTMAAPGAPLPPVAAAPAGGLPGLPGAGPSSPSLPGLPSHTVPGVVALVPAAAAWPPAGWQQHPQSSGHYFKGTEVKTEAELRATLAAPAVAAPPLIAPAVPGLPGLPAVAVPAAFPPEGWQQHPQSAAHWFKGTEVKTEAELRAGPHYSPLNA